MYSGSQPIIRVVTSIKKSFKRGGHTLHQPSGVAITLRMRKKALRRPNPKAKAMVGVATVVAATDAINRNKVW